MLVIAVYMCVCVIIVIIQDEKIPESDCVQQNRVILNPESPESPGGTWACCS